MLRFNGTEVLWNGTSVRDLEYHKLSCAERIEFLCAISPHDPVQVDVPAGDDSRSSAAQNRN